MTESHLNVYSKHFGLGMDPQQQAAFVHEMSQLSGAPTQSSNNTTNHQIQQNFLSGVPPTLVAAHSNIPLYPGYQAMGFTAVNSASNPSPATSRYNQLLAVIEEMGREIRPTYSGSKTSSERLKRGIAQARILLRECLLETERNNSRN